MLVELTLASWGWYRQMDFSPSSNYTWRKMVRVASANFEAETHILSLLPPPMSPGLQWCILCRAGAIAARMNSSFCPSCTSTSQSSYQCLTSRALSHFVVFSYDYYYVQSFTAITTTIVTFLQLEFILRHQSSDLQVCRAPAPIQGRWSSRQTDSRPNKWSLLTLSHMWCTRFLRI